METTTMTETIYAKVCPRGFSNEFTIFAIPAEKMTEFQDQYGDLEDSENGGYTIVYKDPRQWVKNCAVSWEDRNWL
jgi:hypothetical protein